MTVYTRQKDKHLVVIAILIESAVVIHDSLLYSILIPMTSTQVEKGGEIPRTRRGIGHVIFALREVTENSDLLGQSRAAEAVTA